MTRADKSNAAWRLVKQGGFSQSQIGTLTAVSPSTVKNMRRKLRETEAADGSDRLPEMDWEWAQWWKPGDEPPHDYDDWREKKVQSILDRLVKHGLATEFGKYPDFAMEALLRIDPELPTAFLRAAGGEGR